jgi:hypothetical protein
MAGSGRERTGGSLMNEGEKQTIAHPGCSLL